MESTHGCARILSHLLLGLVQFAVRLLHHVLITRLAPTRIDEPIVFGAFETDALRILRAEGLGHLPTDADRHGRVAPGAGIIEIAAKPAILDDLIGIGSSLPNLC